jgi:DNA-binding Lrp family transcriptional regulator
MPAIQTDVGPGTSAGAVVPGQGPRTVRWAGPDPATSAQERSMVVQAYILIQTDVGKAAEVAAEIAELKGITMAEDVTGPYDVIVRAEARNVDELGKLVVARVQTLPGITRTLTCPVVHI